MTKRATPKPQAAAPAPTGAPNDNAPITNQPIEDATAQTVAEGSPMPPALGNEGSAAEAGEGQSSPVNPSPFGEPEDRTTLSEAIRSPNYARRSVLVTGPNAGRWRAGRHFTPEPVSIVIDDLTTQEMDALVTDPLLTVEVIDTPY